MHYCQRYGAIGPLNIYRRAKLYASKQEFLSVIQLNTPVSILNTLHYLPQQNAKDPLLSMRVTKW